MHQTLSNLPRRVLVDTNVLLDSAFVSDGLARKSIAALRRLGFSILLSESIDSEGAEKLNYLILELGLRFDPVTFWRQYLNR
jgi:predicted nucleic acid-binding protein